MVDLIQEAPKYIEVATSVVGVAAVIAALTPTPADDGIVAAVRKVLDILAFNFLNAKNKK